MCYLSLHDYPNGNTNVSTWKDLFKIELCGILNSRVDLYL